MLNMKKRTNAESCENKRSFQKPFELFPIGLGAMPLSLPGKPSEKEAITILKTFLESGGNFIDTADVYGLDETDKGHNEKLISKAVNEITDKKNIIIATKGGATRPNGGWALGGGHPKKLRAACEQSLLNLNIEQHTLYYFHGPDVNIPLEDSLGELIHLKREGKIKHLGIANVTLDELKFASDLTEIVAVQNRCNPFCKADTKNGIIDFCKLNNILYVAYCPLGGWADHAKLISSALYQPLQMKYATNAYVINLAWLMSKGDHVVSIPGMDKKEQIAINFQAFHLTLQKEDIETIDQFPDLYSPKHVD